MQKPVCNVPVMNGELRSYRVRRNLSMREASQRIGVSQATLSRWETGALGIAAERCRDISRVIGIPLAKLRPDLFGEGVQSK